MIHAAAAVGGRPPSPVLSPAAVLVGCSLDAERPDDHQRWPPAAASSPSASPSTSPESRSSPVTPTPASTSRPRRTSRGRSACRRPTSPGSRSTGERIASTADTATSIWSSRPSRSRPTGSRSSLRGALLRRPPGPARPAQRHQITGPETLNGKILCAVSGTTSAATTSRRTTRARSLCARCRRSPSVSGAGQRRGRCGLHRRPDPGGLRRRDQYKGRLKVVGKGFSDEKYGIGVKLGDTAMVDKVNAALKKYIADGSWQGRSTRRSGAPAIRFLIRRPPALRSPTPRRTGPAATGITAARGTPGPR